MNDDPIQHDNATAYRLTVRAIGYPMTIITNLEKIVVRKHFFFPDLPCLSSGFPEYCIQDMMFCIASLSWGILLDTSLQTSPAVGLANFIDSFFKVNIKSGFSGNK